MGDKKFSTIETYLLVCAALIVDAINWIPVINLLTAPASLLGFQLYFKMKGVKSRWSLAGNLIDLIPIVSALPSVTAGVIMTIVVANKKAKIINEV
ncbi:MAG: hypothetical protein COU07_03765 [Candidatus Harrisonbacteria bacterium CG10_big_fil_rev_8_21_14_0_10_40_38]|uniref:Uncharacterized protein n=1 Tax=Candidatus Harrisonbacteria bacterium CG10_big_fil_rev_8_21_14_0_10_40_38 TaxID=1974583 RepID=A0A2H0URC4_9BACT|nr:MAG: hypothetical protein COU07_03765 [Candidatus Harrisonbacteria bacterium CG10_big_fil_rev_8_21_14_0_10_40_38]